MMYVSTQMTKLGYLLWFLFFLWVKEETKQRKGRFKVWVWDSPRRSHSKSILGQIPLLFLGYRNNSPPRRVKETRTPLEFANTQDIELDSHTHFERTLQSWVVLLEFECKLMGNNPMLWPLYSRGRTSWKGMKNTRKAVKEKKAKFSNCI